MTTTNKDKTAVKITLITRGVDMSHVTLAVGRLWLQKVTSLGPESSNVEWLDILPKSYDENDVL